MSKDQTKKQVVVKVRRKDASKANAKPEVKTEAKTAETQVKTKKDLNSLLQGKKIVIQNKVGMRFEGEMAGYINGFFILKDALIVGTKHKAKTELLVVDRNTISHLHLEPTEVTKFEEED